jgi:hypothetical protein
MKRILSNQERDNICDNLLKNKINVTCWQPSVEDPATKNKYTVKLLVIKHEKNELLFKSRFNKDFVFDKDQFVFFFSEKLKIIFKAAIVLSQSGEILVQIPLEITLLEAMPTAHRANDSRTLVKGNSQGDLTGASRISGSGSGALDKMQRIGSVNQDEKFKAMRAAPRSQTSKDQKVTVRFLSKKFNDKEFDLFDLSRSGAGILTKQSEFFSEGDDLEIIMVDGKEINPTLLGKIMAVRTHDLEQGLLIAGVKFG